jgi:ATP-dependent Clp protease protease subunit
MDTSRLPIRTIAIGHVCSMGTVIFTAGTPGQRIMSKNSYMMMHQFSDYGEGKYHEFVAHRKHQDDLHERFKTHFLTRTKLKEKQVNEILLGKSDKWITAQEALKLGLCDKIQSPWE